MNTQYQQIKTSNLKINPQIDTINEFKIKSLQRDLKQSFKEFEKVSVDLNELQCKINSIEENAPR